MSKTVIVGGVAGGASAAARIRRLDEKAEIVIFERGAHVAFSNCSLPYYLGDAVKKKESLIMMTPDDFKKRHNIDVHVMREVVDILREEKCVLVKDLQTGTEYKESYDKLILAPGANAVRPRNIKGVQNPTVFTVRNVTDACRLKNYIPQNGSKHIVIVGGGFVGIEIAENFHEIGLDVSLIEGANQIMSPFDYDMAQILHKEMLDRGIHLYLSSKVTEIADTHVKAIKNDQEFEVTADVVVLSIGVAQETELAKNCGLRIGKSGGIQVNPNYQTNDPNIYAVGDAVETFGLISRQFGSFAQAGPAQRQARVAADHIYGQQHTNHGYIATSCLRVFDQNAACTGLNEKSAKHAGLSYEVAYILPADKVSIMPDSHYMAFKLLFEVPTGRILGAQAIGKGNVTRRIDVIASLLTLGGTLEDLKEIELCYSPVYGTAKDVVNMAALVGLNLLHERVRQVRVEDVRDLVENGAYIIDVREEKEYAAGHLKGSINIPLSQFRERIQEVPRNIPVYLHCRTSQRSYYALCELLGSGYQNVRNISGSFLGICLYEYFNDQTENRTPIVTAYNFK